MHRSLRSVGRTAFRDEPHEEWPSDRYQASTVQRRDNATNKNPSRRWAQSPMMYASHEGDLGHYPMNVNFHAESNMETSLASWPPQQQDGFGRRPYAPQGRHGPPAASPPTATELRGSHKEFGDQSWEQHAFRPGHQHQDYLSDGSGFCQDPRGRGQYHPTLTAQSRMHQPLMSVEQAASGEYSQQYLRSSGYEGPVSRAGGHADPAVMDQLVPQDEYLEHLINKLETQQQRPGKHWYDSSSSTSLPVARTFQTNQDCFQSSPYTAQPQSCVNSVASEPKPEAVRGAPRKFNAASQFAEHKGPITTLMIRNIPCRFPQKYIMDLIDSKGFAGTYDFLYVPCGSRPLYMGGSNPGYGFINFIDPATVPSFVSAFMGYKFGGTASAKLCSVQPAHIQGLENNILQFGETNVMLTDRAPFALLDDGAALQATSSKAPSSSSCNTMAIEQVDIDVKDIFE